MGFEYKIIGSETAVVARLSGVLDRSAAAALTACQQELRALKPRGVVFEMKDVLDIKSESFRPFALLAKGLRDAKTPYCYASLGSDLKRDLIAAGLISRNEVEESLGGALKVIAEKLSA